MTQKILTTSKIQLTLTVRSTSKTRKVAHYWKAHGTGHIKLSVFLGYTISGFFRLSLLASRDFVYPSVRLVTLWVRPHLFCVFIRSFGDLVGASPPILCVRPFVRPMMEDNLWWKTTYDGRQIMIEDDLWWKTICPCRSCIQLCPTLPLQSFF